nr:hypothetical protein [Methylobacterium aquaticum]
MGGDGRDTLYGQAGNDTLNGGPGTISCRITRSNSLSGGDGDDTFDYVSYGTSTGGVDTLSGGAGRDTYRSTAPPRTTIRPTSRPTSSPTSPLVTTATASTCRMSPTTTWMAGRKGRTRSRAATCVWWRTAPTPCCRWTGTATGLGTAG